MLKLKKLFSTAVAASLCVTGVLTGCGSNDVSAGSTSTSTGDSTKKEKPVNLIWYQIGGTQKDMGMVLEEVNNYLLEKINATVEIKQVDWGDYNQKMSVIINSGEEYDLAFTSAWANDYLSNAQKGSNILTTR